MDISNIIMIAFLAVFCSLVIIYRKKFTFQSFGKVIYFGMYKTKVGLKLMDKWAAKYPRILTRLCYLAIGIGFIGMAIVVVDLARSLYSVIMGTSQMTVGLVLPVHAKGVFYVPFIYWILAVAIIVVIHEFAHGLIARLHKIKVRSSGLAFLGVIIPLIPAAFVEPDEKQLRKASRFKQLSVYAAGPFANIVFGFICLGLFLLVLSPAATSVYNFEGVQVQDFMDDNTPAEISGMIAGDVITQINDFEVKNAEDYLSALETAQPGQEVDIKTNDKTYTATLTEDPVEKDAYLGVWVTTEKTMKNTSLFSYFIVWMNELFYWLFLLNLGVGLFNLVPIGPIDGGRMLQTVLEKIMHDKHAVKVWHTVSFVVLAIILSNVVYAFLA